MSSAAEAEVAALYMNAKDLVPLQIIYEKLGHKQPATPMRTDNNTAFGIITGTFKQNRSKAIDIQFYWLRDRVDQGQFRIYLERGDSNLADYFTKFHPASHNRRVRPIYLKTQNLPSSL